MNKIATSAKFQELLKKFGAPSTSTKDHREQKKQAENLKDDAPPSVRKSARDIKQPRRFESPILKSRSKQVRGTPIVRPSVQAKENVSPPPRRPGRPKLTRQEPSYSIRLPRNDTRQSEEAARSKIGRSKPADRPNVADRAKRVERRELSDESDEEYFGSASTPRSPPGGGAFSRMASRNGDHGSPSRPWNDSQFLQPQPLAIRDPRLQNTTRNNNSTRRQLSKNDFASSRRDPHPTYAQPEASMRHPMQSRDASTRLARRGPPIRQHMHSRDSMMRPPFQSRDTSMRHNFVEPDVSYFIRQPYVRLTDVTRSRDFSQRWEDGFLRPPTPPEVQDLVAVEKAKLQDSISKMIDCPHFTALECIYALNSIQGTLVGKMEKFCRKRERTESFLRNTLSETMASRSDRDRVDAWLDSVGPGNQNVSRVAGKRLADQDYLSVPKRRRVDTRYECSRYDNY